MVADRLAGPNVEQALEEPVAWRGDQVARASCPSGMGGDRLGIGDEGAGDPLAAVDLLQAEDRERIGVRARDDRLDIVWSCPARAGFPALMARAALASAFPSPERSRFLSHIGGSCDRTRTSRHGRCCGSPWRTSAA